MFVPPANPLGYTPDGGGWRIGRPGAKPCRLTSYAAASPP
jgi:hypothetical protein